MIADAPSRSLRPYQLDACRAVWEAWRDEPRQLLVLATGCHRAGQQVLMFDGTTKRVENVEVGDALMGPDSTPHNVLALARGRQEMVEVRPTKGEPWTVNLDHVLTCVRTALVAMPPSRLLAGDARDASQGQARRFRRDQRRAGGAYPSQRGGALVDVTCRDVMGKSKHWRHRHKLIRVGVEWPSAPVTIDPYVLGVLLGDGGLSSKSAVSLTGIDPEVWGECSAEAERWGVRMRRCKDDDNRRCPTFRFTGGHAGGAKNGLMNALRELGLSPIACAHRFVPHAYKVTDRRARLEILAGLIDTDGSYNGCGGFEFLSKSRQLADDVTFIARSLGLAAYVAVKRVGEGEYFRVGISGDCSVIPTRIPRKRAPVRVQKKNSLRTGFTLSLTGTVEDYYGFALDGDHRYLLDDFTVTHNTGKTYTAAVIARKRRPAGRTLWLVHRTELLDQAAASLRDVGLSVEIERGDERASRHPHASDVVCASVPSLHESRLETWPPHAFATIVADESHHAVSASWRAVLKRFATDHLGRRTRVLGLTATPDRTDETAMATVFDGAPYRYGMREAIADGWLVPLATPVTVVCEDLDLRQVRVIAGDLSAAELERQVSLDAVLHQIADPLVRESGSRPTVIYTPGVESAHGLARVLAGYVGADAVESIDANTPPERRAGVLAAFARGDLKALANCMILSEGWDSPVAACIAVARPTKSRSLLAQMIGRGSRALPGVVDGHESPEARHAAIAASAKSDLLIVDFTGRDRIDLVGPVDVLAGKDLPDETRRAIAEIRERDPDKPLEDVLVEAEEMAAASEAGRALERRRARVQALTRYVTHPIDLVDMAEHLEVVEAAAKVVRDTRQRACKRCGGTGTRTDGAPCGVCRGNGRVKGNWNEPPPSTAQVDFLARYGIKLPDSALRRQATAAMDLVIARGLCSVKQARVLRRAGLRTDLTRAEAGAAIDALAAVSWQATPEIVSRWGQE